MFVLFGINMPIGLHFCRLRQIVVL